MTEQTTCCTRSDLPWQGRGASLDISGCRFSLYPMDGNYAELILAALAQTDTSKVWAKSDALSTVYRGKLAHVVDALRGLFVHAYQAGIHMAMEGQISKGCPGDVDGDSYLAVEDALQNLPRVAERHFSVQAKIALYPLGEAGYIDQIAQVFRLAEAAGLNPRTIHYATRIEGDVQAIFDYLAEACFYCQAAARHYVLSFTLAVNSPTREEVSA